MERGRDATPKFLIEPRDRRERRSSESPTGPPGAEMILFVDQDAYPVTHVNRGAALAPDEASRPASSRLITCRSWSRRRSSESSSSTRTMTPPASDGTAGTASRTWERI